MRIEALTPLKIKRPAGDMLMTPGEPVEFPDDEGRRLLNRAPGKVRVVAPTIQPGDLIEWQRGGKVQHGTVDFIHIDDTGTRWAFVTLGNTWAAVNLKFARGVGT